MSKLFSFVIGSVFVLTLAGCQQSTQTVPTYTVSAQPLTVEMLAHGEIEAAEAKRIIAPGGQPKVIDWLAPENSQVKKGDVIARFDGRQIVKDSRTEELQMMMIQQDIAQQVAQQRRQVNEIESEQDFVEHEVGFISRFAIDDIRVYSQLEIIETLEKKDFLDAKDTFLDWKSNSVVDQNESEQAVLDIRRQGHEIKYKRHQSALSKLEVVAPFDGLLIYARDQRGEKPRVGQTVFPGHEIATIPNLNEMQAKAYVVARDAISLVPDLPVTIRLDAYPNRTFEGKVKEVGGFPRSIERGNPITYYEVIISFSELQLDVMKPGRKLSAEIMSSLAESALLLPLQALHHDQDNSFVYVQDGLSWERRQVTTDKKNLYFVEIASGLEAGDVVALSNPEDAG